MTDMFVLDSVGSRMFQFTNGSSFGTLLFGSNGSALNQLYYPSLFVMDSQQNFYVADTYNHRVLFWPMGASSGVVVAGTTGVSGSGLSSLNYPTDVALDETEGFMYVCDHSNSRVLRFEFNSTNGTVVAGGKWMGNRKRVSIQYRSPLKSLCFAF